MGKKKTKIFPGLKINRWTVKERVCGDDDNQIGWICTCDCGNEKLIKNIGVVIMGKSTSCGCFRSELLVADNPARRPEVAQKMSIGMKKVQTPENIAKRVVAAQTVEVKEKRKQTNILRHGGNAPACDIVIVSKIKATNVARYGYEVPSQNKTVMDKMKHTHLSNTGYLNPAQNPKTKQKIANTSTKRYGVSSTLSVPEFRQKGLNTVEAKYGVKNITNVSQIPEIRKKMFAHREMSKPEKKMAEFLKNNNFNFKYESECGESGKLWDFVIFDSNEPIIVIEIDGEYVHGLVADSNGIKSGGNKDHERFQKIPDGVMYIQCDSKKIVECFAEILRLKNIKYYDFINEMVERCCNSPFPYPFYSEDRMRKDYNSLLSFDRDVTNKVLIGNSIITSFHKSVFTSRRGNKKSPIEAWQSPELLRRSVENRVIYHGIPNLSSHDITRGFCVSSIAPRVSVFQPALAKKLLSTYAYDAKSVLDPFSGFSGRMLGATSLGMSYTGSDIREETIKEATQIVDFLKLKNVTLSISSIEDLYDINEYYALITCPPYGNTEIWFDGQSSQDEDHYIDLCLQKFNCKVFIFIVKDTNRYKEHVVKSIKNLSHISNSDEQVIVIKKKG